MSRLQELQAEALQMGVKRLAFRGTVGSLAPTSQVTHRAKQHETIQFTKAFPGIARVEVSTPTLAPAVDVVDHLTDGDETPPGTGQLANAIVGTGHRLGRGKYVEIATVATEKIAVVSQRETQKVQALARVMKLDDLRFLAVDGELESAFEQSFDPVDQLPGLIACQDHEVIGVPHELGVGPATGTVRTVEPLLEPVQVEIRQQGGYNPTLRRSLRGSSDFGSASLVGLDDRTFQPHADQLQHRAVGDPSFQALDQCIMRDRIKVRFQIRVIDLLKPGGDVLADRVDRLMSVPSWTKPVRAVQEVRLKDRLEHQQGRRLDDPVFDRGYSQWSHPAVRLRNVDAFDRLRPVAFGAQLLTQLFEEDGGAGAIDDVPARHAVDPGSSVMGQHQQPRGRQHVVPIDPVVQGVKPELGFLLGLLTQFPSQLGDFGRQSHTGLLFWLVQMLVPAQAVAYFRSGTCVQADLLTSDENMNLAGALGSTRVTPLHSYYGPLRLPNWPIGGYGFPSIVDLRSHPDSRPPKRASQVPVLICRRPLSRITPRDPPAAFARCFTGGIRLHQLRKAGHPHLCNEAERVRFRYG